MSTGGPPGVLLDANIFYARTFRDWVVQLYLASDTPLFHVRWTQDVLAEWIYKYRKTNPFVSDSDLGKWRRRVEQTFPRGEITATRSILIFHTKIRTMPTFMQPRHTARSTTL